MKCSAWSSLVISVCSGLAAASPAAAHVVATPPFLAAGDTATLTLAGPNERDVPMTGFAVLVPAELRIVGARSAGAWRPDVQDESVRWAGGSLAPGAEAAFVLELEAPSEPGPATLTAQQLYPRKAVVRWPIGLTVLPPAENPTQNLGWAAVTALAGLLALTIFAAWIWRRRAGSLQEK